MWRQRAVALQLQGRAVAQDEHRVVHVHDARARQLRRRGGRGRARSPCARPVLPPLPRIISAVSHTAVASGGG